MWLVVVGWVWCGVACGVWRVLLWCRCGVVVWCVLLRPSGSQDKLYKLENFGWSVSRPTVTLPLACPNVKNLNNEKKSREKTGENMKN